MIGQMKAFPCELDALCAHTALCVHSGARGTAAATPSTHDHIIRHSGDRHLGSAAQAFDHFSSCGDLGICSSKSMHTFGDFEVWGRQPPDFGPRGRLKAAVSLLTAHTSLTGS